jgi:cell division protein FtsI/penicillin-binding protein 2
LTFRNWKKADGGSMNFAMALTQSCDTWFYQVGMKIGPRLILDYAQQFGFGQRTGLPLASESSGLMPSDDYMLKTHKRRIMNGDVANLSIGQGDATVTPLQMAMAMAAVGNGGTLYAARLVQQVQSIDNQIVTAYDVRARALIDMDKEINKEVHKAMAAVVSSPAGTAGRASVPNVSVAGKTGTAQWGPKKASAPRHGLRASRQRTDRATPFPSFTKAMNTTRMKRMVARPRRLSLAMFCGNCSKTTRWKRNRRRRKDRPSRSGMKMARRYAGLNR